MRAVRTDPTRAGVLQRNEEQVGCPRPSRPTVCPRLLPGQARCDTRVTRATHRNRRHVRLDSVGANQLGQDAPAVPPRLLEAYGRLAGRRDVVGVATVVVTARDLVGVLFTGGRRNPGGRLHGAGARTTPGVSAGIHAAVRIAPRLPNGEWPDVALELHGGRSRASVAVC